MTMKTTLIDFAGVAGLGATTAAFTGVHPLIGVGMATIAGLVALVAQPVFDAIQDSEMNLVQPRNQTAFWTVIACFSLGVSQLAQAAFGAIGYAVGTWQSLAVVAPSWVFGPPLARGVYDQLAAR